MALPRTIQNWAVAADNHGHNMLFGIREHAMGAIVNGIGYYGIFRPSVRLWSLPIICVHPYEFQLLRFTNLSYLDT